MKKEALLYAKTAGSAVRCFLCNHYCRIQDNKFGICGVRQNISGVLYTLVYGKPVAMHIDPIEKKPLYQFLPGSLSFSIATIGCNFRCGFCQNWEISQTDARVLATPEDLVLPEEIVASALKNGCQSISYTYTEPTVFFEYAFDTAKLSRAKGLRNVFVTNGFMTKECIFMIRPYLDAANVDLKFFDDKSYRKICGGSFKPVVDSIRLMHESGIWVEVTTLIVPGENDSEEELNSIAESIAGIDKNIPWHISRFHPDYKFTDRKATDEGALRKAIEFGKKAGLRYIYAGNVYGWGNDTLCPECGRNIIKREVFSVVENKVKEGKCGYCAASIPGVF